MQGSSSNQQQVGAGLCCGCTVIHTSSLSSVYPCRCWNWATCSKKLRWELKCETQRVSVITLEPSHQPALRQRWLLLHTAFKDHQNVCGPSARPTRSRSMLLFWLLLLFLAAKCGKVLVDQLCFWKIYILCCYIETIVCHSAAHTTSAFATIFFKMHFCLSFELFSLF